jgi:hypothetical protein
VNNSIQKPDGDHIKKDNINLHDFKTYTGENKDIYENTPISGAI